MSTSNLRKTSEEASDSFFRSATNLLPDTRNQIPTGSECIDDLLGGGLEPKEITQFYGPPFSGKTHLCHLLCVNLPHPFHAIYIDTERGFRRERIESIANARGLDYLNILPRIHVAQPQNSIRQESYIEEAVSLIKSNPEVKLLIIDSFTSLYKSDYPERSQLSDRASRLNIYLNKLSSLAQANNIAVIITNQNSSYHTAYEEPKPFGGNIVSNMSRYIVRLEHKRRSAIEAVLVKSPLQRYNICHLTLVEGGFLASEGLL
jgi:DNA repair protein RadA